MGGIVVGRGTGGECPQPANGLSLGRRQEFDRDVVAEDTPPGCRSRFGLTGGVRGAHLETVDGNDFLTKLAERHAGVDCAHPDRFAFEQP